MKRAHGFSRYRLGRRHWFALVLFGLFGLASCRAPGGSAEIPTGTYYTRFGLRLERDVYSTTNYRSDRTSVLIPVGTEVEVLGARRNQIQARTSGRAFQVQHVPKHTKDTLREAFDTVFSAQPIDLSQFSADQRAAIERGEAIPGMDRAAVLAGMGPPPAIGTISLESDTWKYWNTRFTTFNVRFGPDGHVTEVGR